MGRIRTTSSVGSTEDYLSGLPIYNCSIRAYLGREERALPDGLDREEEVYDGSSEER
jgi:hypothetical protein